jgi:predicted N-acetyltransferase YhbS
MQLEIRLENESDYRAVEDLTREAFWDVHVPGCCEHYLIHTLRKSPDFIPELDFVAISGRRIAGHIAYAKAHIEDASGKIHPAIGFGPVSVLPTMHKQGIGSALINHSLSEAKKLGYKAVLIYGDPRYYSRFGFHCAEKYDIKTSFGKYAVALLALELSPWALRGISGRFVESPAYDVDMQACEEFDKTFPPKEKRHTPTQDEFKVIASLMY